MKLPAAQDSGLFSRGMLAVLGAQFLSALADNALLFAAIALLKARHAPPWQMPLLQEAFVVAFVLLAPFAGPFADAIPKGRALFAANCLKLLGVGVMLFGAPPIFAYNLVGIGAALYSPAKYGILGELVGPEDLVKANSLMEGSTIVAILLGAVAGGFLADWSVHVALELIVACYLLAAVSNLLIPRLPAAHPMRALSPISLFIDFRSAFARLLQSPDARFSLLGTSVFWGAGSTLRFLLVAWVPVALMVNNNHTPATLSGVVAIGIAIGAAGAARWITLKNINRALPAGIAIGALIITFAHVTQLSIAVGLLVLIGACGGFYVVPLNALLQERGRESVGAGHSIAVQNFFENASMLLMVGLYVLMMKAGLSVILVATGFGVLVLVAIASIALMRLRMKPAP